MSPNEDLFRRVMQAFNRGYAGEPGTFRPRQTGKTAAGISAVLEFMKEEGLFDVNRTPASLPLQPGSFVMMPVDPDAEILWAVARRTTLPFAEAIAEARAYQARKPGACPYKTELELAVSHYRLILESAWPEATDSCTCPEHGSWYHAEDIDRMVKEISDALGSTAIHPKLCDIVVETVRAIGTRPSQPVEGADDRKYSAKELLEVADELDDAQYWKAAEMLRFYASAQPSQDAAQPRPVGVPDALKPGWLNDQVYRDEKYVHGWNDCRKAMIAAAPEVPRG